MNNLVRLKLDQVKNFFHVNIESTSSTVTLNSGMISEDLL